MGCNRVRNITHGLFLFVKCRERVRRVDSVWIPLTFPFPLL